MISSPLSAQEPPKSFLEYNIPGSQATVYVEFLALGNGHVTANVKIRRGQSEKLILNIESNFHSITDRKITFPTQFPSSTNVSADFEKPFSAEGMHSDSLALGGLQNRYLLVSVPESIVYDRLVMIDLEAAEADLDGRSEFRSQQILVPKHTPDVQRTYSVKAVSPAAKEKPTNVNAPAGTMLAIADVDKDGKIRTFGTGLVVHQVFFLMDKNFINLSHSQQVLALRNDGSYEIIDKSNRSVAFRSLGIHHTPGYLPYLEVRDGSIDPVHRFGGPIHPQIIEVITRQGSNGILALPYLPLRTRDAKPIANLFDSFSPEYRADLTIEQASVLPKIEISNRESVEKIRDAIMLKSTVTAESKFTKKGHRVRQEKGLAILQSISSQFPPALDALKEIALSADADSTLRAMAKTAAHQVERETKQSPNAITFYKALMNSALDSSRCARSFVSVPGN